MPQGWSFTKLSNISKLITKGTTPRGGNVAYLDKGIGFLRAENVDGYDKLSLDNLKYISNDVYEYDLKRSILEGNDVLITIAGTLGRTGIVRKNDLPLNVNQAVAIIRLVTDKYIDLRYLIYVLNSPVVQMLLSGQKKITAIPNLTLEIIGNCTIVLAPINEQKRIVSKIDCLFSLISH